MYITIINPITFFSLPSPFSIQNVRDSKDHRQHVTGARSKAKHHYEKLLNRLPGRWHVIHRALMAMTLPTRKKQ